MATAAPSFSSTKETTNYARLCRLLVDVGTQALRDTFNRIHPPTRLHGILASELPTLRSLRNRKILNATQWGKLYPTIPSSVSSASFDITLLMVLLRNICGLNAPASTGSWDILPPASDNSIEANIARIKYYRNNVYGHATQASIDEPTFHLLWLEISNALLALVSSASYTSAISQLKTECMDPDVEEHYRELLKEWKKDDDSTKEKLEQLEEMLKTQAVHTQEFQEMVMRKLETHEVHTQDKLKEIQGSVEQCKAEEGITEVELLRVAGFVCYTFPRLLPENITPEPLGLPTLKCLSSLGDVRQDFPAQLPQIMWVRKERQGKWGLLQSPLIMATRKSSVHRRL
ncbi:uncharacterized protein [Montipora foliosa]|uniref:uncharacterized protein isoform X2 n=1 Tax=Montipora foliosa TaxID=591990 RepID=UPI0035F1F39D